MGGELSHIAVDGRQLLDQIAERAETAFRHQWAQAQDAAVRDAVLERTAGALSMFAEKRTSAAHRPRAQAAMRILNAQAESVLRSPQAGAVGVAPDGLAFLRNRALPQTIKLAADVLVRAAETDKQRRAD
ncbi:MAG TPA: hypothetical protein VGE27_17820 [Gemmatimonas sp.]|uniref:hypothetical protein n=1 Tax=Gemmatimonas sp. TaxID=1962908 RepID=UPI002ED9750E